MEFRLLAVIVATAFPAPARAQLEMMRVDLTNPSDVQRLSAQGFEVAGVRRVGGAYVGYVVADPEGVASLRAAGFAPAAVARAPRAPGAPRFFHDFDDPTTGIAARLADAARSPWVTVDTIGFSVEGRPLLVAKVGAPDESPSRANVLFLAGMHAREWITPAMAMGLLAHLDSASTTGSARAIVDDRDIWIVPMANPDGYQYTFDTERLWRKNRRANADGSAGVDLNRNFPAAWGIDSIGSSDRMSSNLYRGRSPASEPETRAVVEFHRRFPPAIAVSYHSFSNLILYPYSHAWGRLPPDRSVFRALTGTNLAPAIVDTDPASPRFAYRTGPAWMLYPANGEYTEWAYRAHGTLALTVELTAGCCRAGEAYGFEFPDDNAAIARVVRDNIPFALALIDAAADPARARGPGGRQPARAEFESVWPALQAVGDQASSGALAVIRNRSGTRTIALGGDSLGLGSLRRRVRGQLVLGDVPDAAEVPSFGVATEMVQVADPDRRTPGWAGWPTDTTAFSGSLAWAAADGTLLSPAIPTLGHDSLRLAFWTRHLGFMTVEQHRGAVEYSTDDGVAWTRVALLAGNTPVFYPMAVTVPVAGPFVRFRFVAEGFPWWIDAVHVTAPTQPTRLSADGVEDGLGVSENPVRSGRVYLSWPATTQDATVSVMTFRGDLVFRETVDGGTNVLLWNLENRAGAAVSRGAYIVIVQVADRVYRRRLFVTARP